MNLTRVLKPAVTAGFGAIFALAAAADPEPVTLEPLTHADATLTITDASGAVHDYAPEDLEAFPTYRLVTTTPWREEPATFEGPLLRDILEDHDLATTTIRVTAENGFATNIEPAVWQNVTVLVATRVNGRAHSRRERGPIQFVIPAEEYGTSSVTTESHLVWMAATLEPAD